MKTLSLSLLTTATLALATLPSVVAAAAPCGTDNLLRGKKPSATQAVKGDLTRSRTEPSVPRRRRGTRR